MPAFTQLSKTDTLFVAGEGGSTYNHTAGLLLLDTSDQPGFDFNTFRARMIERLDLVPQFRWKLHELPLELDLPYWVEDENFTYRHHIKCIGVPAPGDLRALSDVAGHLFSKQLDRSKPLWEAWFIEGVAEGRCAVMLKLHHCMMDGQGAIKLLEILCSLSPDAAPAAVPEAIATAKAGATPTLRESSIRTYGHLMRLPGVVGKNAIEMLAPRLRRRLAKNKSAEAPVPFQSHPALNANIGSERGFVFGSLPLADILAVKKHFEVSVNDVVLALAGGALRRYLLVNDTLPARALRCTIPVSLRSAKDDDFSNKVTNISVTLATEMDDPVQRLRAINAETSKAKGSARSGGKSVIDVLQIMPPLLVGALARNVNPEQAANMLGANLIVSNVRGCPVNVYLAGARVDTLYPMSVITAGMALNITCVSYADRLDFGLTLDPDVIDDPWSLMSGIETELAAYIAFARRKKTAGGSTKRRTRR
jgi:diacylglycerol O-acyltransferase